MLNHLYFYAVDPGAVSVMQAIVDSSPDDVQCFWVAEGYAMPYLELKGIEYFDINNLEKSLKAGVVLVLGSQMNSVRTADMINSFSCKRIQTIFIFDHWCNYNKHFTLSDGTLALPTRIFVMDEYVKGKLVKLGVDGSRICIIGHPGIEFEVNEVKVVTRRRKQKIREKTGVAPGDMVVLLALEPLSDDFPVETLDYDEYSIALLVHQAIQELKVENLQLVMRLHSRQSRSTFYDFLQSNKLHEEVILCPQKMSVAESLAIADMVIGITSVFLIKALALGKPSVSLQFNPKFNSDKIPYLEKIKINNPSELSFIISEKLSQGSNEKISFPTGSIKKAWHEIRILLSDESH